MSQAAARFGRAVLARDPAAMEAVLAEDVVFRSPAVHQAYAGKVATMVLLRSVLRVFEDFRYERTIGAADAADHALVFRTRIGDREIEGADFLHTGADGAIDELTVMVRPLNGVLALAEAMKAKLAGA